MVEKNVEEWRPIPEYEGLYEISDQGRVRSLARDVIMGNGRGGLHHLPQRVLKPATNRQGYLQVGLWKNGKVKLCRVNRLVAQTFLPNSEGLTEVNHIDECKTNNTVANLEWCDRAYNINYGTRNERVAAALTNGKLSKPVQQLTMAGELVTEYPSIIEAARQTGWSLGHIGKCCKGGFYRKGKWVNLHSYKGFKWCYP